MPRSPRAAEPVSATTTPAARPVRRRRRAEDQEEFRRLILGQAKQLYRAGGYAGLSVRGIAAAIGMSPMALYSYFPSKQALVKHIWIDFFKELLGRMLDSARGRRTPLDVLRASVLAFVEYWEEHPDHFRMVYLHACRDDGGPDLEYSDDPVYEQVIALNEERFLACVQGAPSPERAARQLRELSFVKMMGYLYTTLALGRYPIANRAQLKRSLVDDILRSVESAVK